MPKKAQYRTDRWVASRKGPGRYAVGGVDGLHLRITSTGSRSWVLRVKVGDLRRDIGIGPYPFVTLEQARQEAFEIHKRIRDGADPLAKRREVRQAIKAQQAGDKTFSECAAAYIEAKAPEWKNPKHRQQWENTLSQYAYPVMGSLAVADIDLPHVLAVLEPIWTTKTETASRLRGRIESVLDWATVRKYRTGLNPARWKGHLDTILPARGKVQKVEHHKAMPIDDMPGFWRDLAGRDGMGARALQLVILTAARSGEVRGATWDEIDLDAKTWTIPASRMKAGAEHRVPLSDTAVALLKAVPRLEGCPYVFHSVRSGQLSDMSLTAVMRRMGLAAVPHGFRSTFRDWCGERTHYPRELAEQALAHTLANRVEAAYRRGDALEKRRDMMQAWADFLRGE
ncbi:Integrase [Castellaniella defragrans 65Phen]|uniref:Integrase n=1 Tax=Castellaniella defragrans (strain DSM 12143 / CCUG 39792 / 65Phen) TaxID=1437824 RepID=W8WVW4_CASD6|nr:site-specific integrase [Castellaniella defragrans]CDM23873.1 Integrase [Castellaniella defragrans 65Phen]